MQRTVEALRETGKFVNLESIETLERRWNVTRTSVRPDHRMVAHTGFLTFATKIGTPAERR